MKKLLAASFSIVALIAAACSAGGAAGTYLLDKARWKTDTLASVPEETKKQPAFEQTLKALDDGSMTIELKADGSASIVARGELLQGSSALGSWQLEGTRLTLTTKDGMTGKEETHTADYADGAFSFEMGTDGPTKMKMHFRRR